MKNIQTPGILRAERNQTKWREIAGSRWLKLFLLSVAKRWIIEKVLRSRESLK
jgi:hypothetical protein